MQIAVSGTHASGKSTLVAELAHVLPDYRPVEEPYYALVDEGHFFSDPPSQSDYELQLGRSLYVITREPRSDIIFERCPVDYLAYLASLRETDPDTVSTWLTSVVAAMPSLDLVVYVPLEDPDWISVSAAERPRLRRRVDAILREILVDDAWGIAARVLEVRGSVTSRVAQVIARIGSGSPADSLRA